MTNDKINSPETGNRLYLVARPLSLMEFQTVTGAEIEGRLFFFNLANLPVVNRIIPRGTLIISAKKPANISNLTEVNSSEIGTNLHKNSGNYYSSVEGFLIYEKETYNILQVTKSASFMLTISDDAMEVKGDFFPAAEGYPNIAYDEIIKEFKELKITVNPDFSLVMKTIKTLASSKSPIYDVVIARGSKSEPGRDGRVEFLVDTEKSNKPNVTDNGRIDFYNVSSIVSVGKDQKLAIVHPPVQGKAGVDVFGKVLPAGSSKKAPNPKSTNTYFDEKNPNILRAKISGYLANISGKLSVSEDYNVRGNVDFHTGNIVSKGAVKIDGDVRSGFKLDLDKDIIINGTIGDADIKSGGSILVNGGFVGKGNGKISARGDVSVKHIRNQTVVSEGDIIIGKEAVDSNLFAKGNILSMNGQTVIFGGSVIAGKNIEVRTLGNDSGAVTKIQVGIDYELLEKYNALNEEVKQLKRGLTEKEGRIKSYSHIKNLTENAKQNLTQIINEYKELKELLNNLGKKVKEIQKILRAPSKSKVIVSGFIYPGVEIKIQNTTHLVKEKTRNATFALSQTKGDIIKI